MPIQPMFRREINKPIIYKPMASEGLNPKSYYVPYYKGGVLVAPTEPVHRYAKNYKLGPLKYSLAMITRDSDSKKVEKWLDKTAKSLSAEDKKHIDEGYKSGTGIQTKYLEAEYEG